MEENETAGTSQGTATEPQGTTEQEKTQETTTIWWQQTRQGTVQPDAEDLAVYNRTADERHMRITVSPTADEIGRFDAEFTLAPQGDSGSQRHYSEIEQMSYDCRIIVTDDEIGDQSFDWDGDDIDRYGLDIFVENREIDVERDRWQTTVL